MLLKKILKKNKNVNQAAGEKVDTEILCIIKLFRN